jgi:hypothetical protein
MTWAFAGVELDTNESVSFFGVPFRVGRADLLPIGLILTSAYCAISHFYFASMLGLSPYRTRRDLLEELRLIREKVRQRRLSRSPRNESLRQARTGDPHSSQRGFRSQTVNPSKPRLLSFTMRSPSFSVAEYLRGLSRTKRPTTTESRTPTTTST